MVDFGGMTVDTVAVDLARLIGSLVDDDDARWEESLGYYTECRPLSKSEIVLARTFDRAGVLGAAINWLRWIFVEGRQFENREGVEQRVHAILRRWQKYL